MWIYLVDCENVGYKTFKSFREDYRVVYFYSQESSNSILLRGIDTAIKVNHDGSKNALDFIIDSYLGYLIAQNSRLVNYHIVSEDKGYETVCKYWRDRGYNVTCGALDSDSEPLEIYQCNTGETLVSTMSESLIKKCKNVYKSYNRSKAKDKGNFIIDLSRCLNKYSYSKSQIHIIADYLIEEGGSI